MSPPITVQSERKVGRLVALVGMSCSSVGRIAGGIALNLRAASLNLLAAEPPHGPSGAFRQGCATAYTVG
jgi:hypothetical protein